MDDWGIEWRGKRHCMHQNFDKASPPKVIGTRSERGGVVKNKPKGEALMRVFPN